MPGLMGIVCVDNSIALCEEFASEKLNIMEKTLLHRSVYQVQRWTDSPKKIFFGSVGHSDLMGCCWHNNTLDREKAPSDGMLYGVIHGEKNGSASVEQLQGLTVENLRCLSGFYSLAFVEGGKRRFVVAVDQRASVPVYYTQFNGVLYFAPEVKALLAVCNINGKLDDSALATFIGTGHLVANQTFFESIRRLPGGHALIVEGGKIRIKEYWRFNPGSRKGRAKEDLTEELGEKVSSAVARNLGTPSKTMIFLSGGADSRAILGGALEAVHGDGRCLYTVSWGIDSEEPGSDASIAQLIAREYDLNHRFMRRSSSDYGQCFRQVNYLIDGMCDVVAFHQNEFRIMEKIRTLGFRRVLRGDSTFGYKGRVYDALGALSAIGIRRFRSIGGMRHLMLEKPYRRFVEAGDAIFDNLLEVCKDMEPNDAKEYLYFTQRFQNYMGSARYYKQVLFDHRNPLMDETILDFMSCVQRELRENRILFIEALKKRYSKLLEFPFAISDGLEDWRNELGSKTAMRDFFANEVADEKSGIWEYFERKGVVRLFEATGHNRALNIKRLGFKKRIKSNILQSMTRIVPSTTARLLARRTQRYVENRNVFLRIMILKDWHDRFVE